MYFKVKGQSLFQVILCGVEAMPTQIDAHFCLGISSTQHKMASNILWHKLWNTLLKVACLAPYICQTLLLYLSYLKKLYAFIKDISIFVRYENIEYLSKGTI